MTMTPPLPPRRSLHRQQGDTTDGRRGDSNGSSEANESSHNGKRMPYLNHDDLHRFVTSSSSASNSNSLTASQLKDQWISISPDVEYLPISTVRSLQNNDDALNIDSNPYSAPPYNPYSVQPFIHGMNDYDEYQQAWRLLGFMIDCNTVIYDDDNNGNSHDSKDGYVTEDGCARYVLWAAYVDTAYEGGGIGEYQYWDRENEVWDDTACFHAEGGGSGSRDNNKNKNNNGDDDNGYKSRCAKMDCHLEDTSFSVLGFFKHQSYDDWMEQLFKHEGMCVWTDEEYAFMKNARKAWPQGCTDTGYTITIGDDLEEEEQQKQQTLKVYYNIKPSKNGRIAIGLYTDTQCFQEYPVDSETLESYVGNIFQNTNSHDSGDNNYDFSSDTLEQSMSRWDSAFDAWRICQPCVAYDLENVNGTKYTNDDDDYYNYYWWWYNNYRGRNKEMRGRDLGGEYDAQGDVFECYDDAGYTNVNQCMKFSAKTVMKTATFRDISMARHQGTLTENPLSGYIDSSRAYHSHAAENAAVYAFLVAASLGFAFSIWRLLRAAGKARRAHVGSSDDTVNFDSPLV